MRPTHRTQPYRADFSRMPGMALDAMQRGRAPGAPINAGDFTRQRLNAAATGIQALLQQRMGPQVPPGGGGIAVDHWGGPPVPPRPTLRGEMNAGMGMGVTTGDHWGGTAPPSVIPPRTSDPKVHELHSLILQAMNALQRQKRHRGNGGIAAPPIAHI